MAECSDCRGPISRQNRSGFCRGCSLKNSLKDPAVMAKREAAFERLRKPVVVKHCGCGELLGSKNLSGNCRRCTWAAIAKRPDVVAKRQALTAHLNSDPEIQRTRRAKIKEYFAKPGVRAARREMGREIAKKTLCRPEVRAKAMAASFTPEALAKRSKSRSDNMLAWCPEEYRDHYRKLLYRTARSAAEARREVLNMVQQDRTNDLRRWRLSDAVFFLRRLAPVTPKGDGYQYGTTFLSPEQLVERALQRGWQP